MACPGVPFFTFVWKVRVGWANKKTKNKKKERRRMTREMKNKSYESKQERKAWRKGRKRETHMIAVRTYVPEF